MILETTDYNAIKSKRLFGTLLGVCLETIAGDPKGSPDLWKWAKAVDDSYVEELEQEYQIWKKEFYL